jgi:serine/threonine-protein kinase HipA
MMNSAENYKIYEIDYLLGVFDESRMGALRFKTELDGSFLDNDAYSPTPLWSSLGDLQEAAKQLESDDQSESVRKWIAVLVAPGSSLGGARPKANIFDSKKNFWITKFLPKTDTYINSGGGLYLTLRFLIRMTICVITDLV